MTRFNTFSSPDNGKFTISKRHGEDDFLVSWKRGQTTHGIVVRFGAIPPLTSLLKEAGYTQVIEPDVENDEFQCEECQRIYDIEDSIKKNGRLICFSCTETEE